MIRVEFFHDVLCGWCYALSPRVRRLVEEHPDVVVEHRCFALAPTPDAIVAIFGSKEAGKAEIPEHWRAANRNDDQHRIRAGLMATRPFDYPWSMPGLKACKAAEVQGGHAAHGDMFDRVQRAHLTECRNIADFDVLRECAKDVGLDVSGGNGTTTARRCRSWWSATWLGRGSTGSRGSPPWWRKAGAPSWEPSRTTGWCAGWRRCAPVRDAWVDLLQGGGPRYLVLATYRRNGQEVRTPVWCAVMDGKLVVRTGSRTGKAKRIRAQPRVRVAVSDARGRPLGPWKDATARRLSDPELCRRAEEALATKYRIAFRLVSLLNRLGRRRLGAPVYYELHLVSADVWRWEAEAAPVCDWTTGRCGPPEEVRP